MSFIADKQTLDDLNILGKYKAGSVYNFFNRAHTRGGERLLEHYFHHPLSDADQINGRAKVFQYFQEKEWVFPFEQEECSVMENYLEGSAGHSFLRTTMGIFRKKIERHLIRDEEYDKLLSELLPTIRILWTLKGFIARMEGARTIMTGKGSLRIYPGDNPYQENISTIKRIFADPRLEWLSQAADLQDAKVSALPLMKVIRYDHLLRSVLRKEMDAVMEFIHHLDVCITVGHVARTRNFSCAKALPPGDNIFQADALSHPCLEKGITNPVSLYQDSNVLFLTGANMAGKSTFMKSVGISLYLAHMGFPLAAKGMVFSVRDGLFTSINVSDNLSLGYSHFYAEVLRVKKVAEEVSAGKDLVVIFDELFKGTNVKDAYDATLAVTEAFARNRNCLFLISTHIIEVGETLRENCKNLQFAYLPTTLDGTTPKYTYRMKEGITSDRHGMMIIENEGILELIGD